MDSYGFDTELEISLKEPEVLKTYIEDIPEQAKKYSDCISAIEKDLADNTWEGADGAALKTKFDGYLATLKARQAELEKLCTLANGLKGAVEKAEANLKKNIVGGEE